MSPTTPQPGSTELERLLDALPIPVVRFDRDLRLDYLNRVAVDVGGRPPEDVLGRTNIESGGDSRLTRLFDASLRQVLESGTAATFDFHDEAGPADAAVRATLSPLRAADGTITHVVAIAVDISDLAVTQRQLEERDAILRVMLDLTADSIVRFDPDLRYDYVNDRTVELVGLPREAWIGRTQAELGYTPDDVALRERRIRQVFESGEPSTYHDEFTFDDRSAWFETQLFPQVDAGGTVSHVIVVARDITARKLAEQELVRAAEHDPLTGLANRSALIEEIGWAIESGRRTGLTTAVLLVDLDHFKHVNDSLGHAIGDQLLCQAAERLHHCVRASDLVARHGGDEFVVVMRDLHDHGDAVHLAERIVSAFREPLVTGDTDLATTASVGISLSTPNSHLRSGVDAHDLLREADTAMYAVKKNGRDGISLFDEELHAEVGERLRTENELRGALGRGELAVWYQPEIGLADGRVRAVEALLRWHHPSGELYTAARFIDVATETGLIVEIGYWMLHEVCTQAARWADPEMRIRVNLAPRQLDDPALLPQVDHAMAAAGIDGRYLCAEITETALLHDTQVVRENLLGLTDRGITVALDDFGTGYASLTYLRRYHIDLLKIDRSFITHIAECERDQRLTAAVVALAHQLDMAVTAEGVEHPEQAEIVRDLGCTGAQGYLYSPAVPAETIDQMLLAPDAATA